MGIAVLGRRLPAAARAVVAAMLLLYPPLNERADTPSDPAGLALPWGDLAALTTLIVVFIVVVAATSDPRGPRVERARHSATEELSGGAPSTPTSRHAQVLDPGQAARVEAAGLPDARHHTVSQGP